MNVGSYVTDKVVGGIAEEGKELFAGMPSPFI